MTIKLFTSLAILAGLAAATAASAGPLYFDAATHQLSPPAGVTFSAIGGDVGYDVREGIGFIGVTLPGGNVEIDDGQTLILNFATPQIFSDLTLGLLFDDEFSDDFEAAGVLADGSSFKFILAVTGSTTATWNGAGATVTNLSPAAPGGGGVWSITTPFAGLPVSELRFTSAPGITNNSSGDYGLVRFTSHSVPDAGTTAALLAAALASMLFVARRKQ